LISFLFPVAGKMACRCAFFKRVEFVLASYLTDSYSMILSGIYIDGSKNKANASQRCALSGRVAVAAGSASVDDAGRIGRRKKLPDRMEVRKAIALRQQRLAVLNVAKRKLEARAK
jgi:hypothetical protein